MLTDEQKSIIKSTAPILQENGKEIASRFYRKLFKTHPELLNMFNQTNQKIGAQPLALANTIYLAAENIDHLDVLMPWIKIVGYKHRALMVKKEHYEIVGRLLLHAIAKTLGDKATPAILDAWSSAYDIIASVFIDVEAKLYAELGEDAKSDYIPLKIVKKETIGDGSVTSLTMKRCDGKEMCPFRAGQYLTLRVHKNGYFHNRHYSLTHPFNGKTYSVAVKQEKDADPPGVVSNEIANHFHKSDIILASLPAGDFVLTKDAKRHLFVAGGIGITTFVAMINELKNQNKSHRATLIYYVSKKGSEVFFDEIQSLLQEDQYMLLDSENPVTKDLLQSKLTSRTHVYICGSPSFINKIKGYLTECNHPESQVSFESFVPTLALLNAVKDQTTTKVL